MGQDIKELYWMEIHKDKELLYMEMKANMRDLGIMGMHMAMGY